MSWRRWVRVLHRDVGYFLSGLVVIYAISGIAVNHIDSWNPNYAIRTAEIDLGPLPAGDVGALEEAVVERASIDPAEVRGRHRQGPDRFVVFLEHGGKAEVAPSTGKGTVRRVSRRPFLFEFNALHVNALKGAWTLVADVFSLLLLGLAVTGLLMLGGKPGFAGRGKWFVLGGLVVPAIFIARYLAGL